MFKFYTNVGIHGNYIYLRGYQDGKAVKKKIEYRPYLFIPTPEGDHSDLRGRPMSKLKFDTLRDGRNYYNYTINQEARFEHIDESSKLQNKYGRFPVPDTDGKTTLHGMQNFQYTYLFDNYKDLRYDPALIKVGHIDIETSIEGGFPNIDEADREITAITIRSKNKIIAFGCGDFTPKEPNVTYIKCKDEDQLLYKFLDAWEYLELDVVTGWNIEFFDIPYIVNRITRQLGEAQAKRLSPWGILEKKQVVVFNREHTVYNPMGIAVLDYLAAYKKFAFTNQESFKLDHVAFMELGERKLNYDEYDNLNRLYKENFQLYMEYNVKDVNLVYRLDEKLKILELIYAMAYDALVNYADTFTTVRIWDVVIHNYLLKQKVVIPFNDVKGRQADDRTIEGAYVKDPKVGMHNWVVSFDINSLYPHLIMQYNLSPETMIGALETPPSVDAILKGAFRDPKIVDLMITRDATIASNGVVFRRDKQGFLPALMQKMYNDRVQYKKKYIAAKKKYEKTHSEEDAKLVAQYFNLQQAKKIQLNSGYGALANLYFRFFDPRIAEAITMSGQLSIRWAETWMNKEMNKLLGTTDKDYVVAVDTDSMYIHLGDLVDREWKHLSLPEQVQAVDDFCENVIQKHIDEAYKELAAYVNAREQKMVMKREAIANKGLWTAKKRYVLNMYDLEGVRYEEPKLKIMGSEAIRTSTPAAIRDEIRRMLFLILNTDEQTVQKEIASFQAKFKSLPFEDIANPRSCNGIQKWSESNGMYKKSTPIHVKGAIMYNKLLKDRGLDNDLSPIMEGEKIKYIYMRLPNPLQVGVLSVPGNLPRQLKLEQYIDYDTQFDKAFLEPMRSVLHKVGWTVTKINTLDSLFT